MNIICLSLLVLLVFVYRYIELRLTVNKASLAYESFLCSKDEEGSDLYDTIDLEKLFTNSSPDILLHNKELLCVRTMLNYVGNDKNVMFPIYQTVSLDSGELLELDDIVNITLEFVEYIYNSPSVIKAVRFEEWDTEETYENKDAENRDYIRKNYTQDELLECLKLASVDYDKDNYTKKYAFYLTPGELNIVRETEAISICYFKIRIDIDDIEEYIRVKAW